jgi:hypothetical protein
LLQGPTRSANKSAKLVGERRISLLYPWRYDKQKSAKTALSSESVQRIEPARLEEIPEAITDVVAELAAAAAILSSIGEVAAGHLAIVRELRGPGGRSWPTRRGHGACKRTDVVLDKVT